MFVGLCAACTPLPPAGEPLRLHPANSRYFELQGKPLLLVGGGEHYGAVINQDFDYVAYLDTLARDGLNLTRVFTGTHVEDVLRPWNVMAPAPGRLLVPWARSGMPGYVQGGNKFDLTRWDDAYFARLKDFIAQARKRGVVVELTLFSAHYEEWPHSPLNPANNVNGMGPVNCEHAYPLADSRITQVQEALTVKLVTELNEFDNLYYELINEPYMKCGATDAWQAHMARLIARTEVALPRRHLVAQNIANGAARVERLPEGISILNFHYASPPDAVAANAPLRVPVAFDESGFRGPEDAVYRRQAWEFVMAGGAVFNNLDWSFTVASPTGHNREWDKGLGGGGPALRRALGALGRFIHGFDFVRMAPDQDVIQGGLPPGAVAYALAEPGRQYAIHVHSPQALSLQLALPPGAYRVEWVDTGTGDVLASEGFRHGGGSRTLASPAFSQDVALAIRARE